MAEDAMGGCSISVARRPGLLTRVGWRLGYLRRFTDVDRDPDAAKLPRWLKSEVAIGVSFWDRVLILVSGRAQVTVEVRCSADFAVTKTDSAFWPAAPWIFGGPRSWGRLGKSL